MRNASFWSESCISLVLGPYDNVFLLLCASLIRWCLACNIHVVHSGVTVRPGTSLYSMLEETSNQFSAPKSQTYMGPTGMQDADNEPDGIITRELQKLYADRDVISRRIVELEEQLKSTPTTRNTCERNDSDHGVASQESRAWYRAGHGLSVADVARYSRQLLVPRFGVKGENCAWKIREIIYYLFIIRGL